MTPKLKTRALEIFDGILLAIAVLAPALCAWIAFLAAIAWWLGWL